MSFENGLRLGASEIVTTLGEGVAPAAYASSERSEPRRHGKESSAAAALGM